ncbi:hypothetical protein D3C76_1299600 [compost metagenome]
MCHIMVLFVERKLFGVLDLKYEIPIIVAFSMFLYHGIEEPARKVIRMISEGGHREPPQKNLTGSFALPAAAAEPEPQKERPTLA